MWKPVYEIKGRYLTEVQVIETPKGFLVVYGGIDVSTYKRKENAIRCADRMAKM